MADKVAKVAVVHVRRRSRRLMVHPRLAKVLVSRGTHAYENVPVAAEPKSIEAEAHQEPATEKRRGRSSRQKVEPDPPEEQEAEPSRRYERRDMEAEE